jgi:hypothetical protein
MERSRWVTLESRGAAAHVPERRSEIQIHRSDLALRELQGQLRTREDASENPFSEDSNCASKLCITGCRGYSANGGTVLGRLQASPLLDSEWRIPLPIRN